VFLYNVYIYIYRITVLCSIDKINRTLLKLNTGNNSIEDTRRYQAMAVIKQTYVKYRREIMCYGRVSISCSTCGSLPVITSVRYVKVKGAEAG